MRVDPKRARTISVVTRIRVGRPNLELPEVQIHECGRRFHASVSSRHFSPLGIG
jgi:hypothetical protein